MTTREQYEANGYKTYENDEIQVFWNPNKCQHAGECGRGNKLVFDSKRRPWVDVNQAPASEIAAIIDKCPSQALMYKLKDSIIISFDEANQRSVAHDGEKEIGECVCSMSEKHWIIAHTEVNENYGGRGIAKKLVEKVVAEARLRGVKIIPLCPYANKMMTGKPEYADVL